MHTKKTKDLKIILLRSFTLTANFDNRYLNEGPCFVLVFACFVFVCFVQNERANCMLIIYFSMRCIIYNIFA